MKAVRLFFDEDHFVSQERDETSFFVEITKISVPPSKKFLSTTNFSKDFLMETSLIFDRGACNIDTNIRAQKVYLNFDEAVQDLTATKDKPTFSDLAKDFMCKHGKIASGKS